MTRYECDKCGACCQGHLIVEADDIDVIREPRLIEADRHRAGWSLPQVLEDLQEPGRCLLIAVSRPCPFLSAENLCTIYSTRPNDCVAMPTGDEQCQLARKAAGLPELQPLAAD